MLSKDKTQPAQFVEFEKPPTRVYLTDDDKVREAVETVEMLQDIETIVLGFRRIMERREERRCNS